MRGKKAWMMLSFMALVFAGSWCIKDTANAAGDTTRYVTRYLSVECPGVNKIAEAYLVGTDNIPKHSSLINIYSVPVGTKIQGKTIDAKYFPHDNMENLKQLYSEVQGYQNFTWANGEYIENETTKLDVVAYDSQKVIFWSNGYRSFGPEGPVMCKQYMLMMSHPPGFYQVSRNQVWLDLGRQENRVPDGEVPVKVAEGRVTSSLVGISPVPGVADSGDVFMVPVNEKLDVVSTEPIASTTPGKTTDTYYKILFNAKTVTNYMTWKSPGYYYVKSKYINLYRTGIEEPKDAIWVKIHKLKANGTLSVRSAPQTGDNIIGYLQNDAEVQMFENESTDKWATIYYNNTKAYILASYVNKDIAPVKKDVTNLRIKDIVDNQYILTWDEVPKCTDYRVAVVQQLPTNRNHVGPENNLYREYHYTSNELKIGSDFFAGRNYLAVIVAANFGDNPTEYTYIELTVPGKPRAMPKSYLKAGKNKIRVGLLVGGIQYGTKKSFKNAKTKYKGMFELKKLKPNTTYYIRYKNVHYVKTDNGEKPIYSDWSGATKIKTKKGKVGKSKKTTKKSKKKQGKSSKKTKSSSKSKKK